MKILPSLKEINPDKPDNSGLAPLSYAARPRNTNDSSDRIEIGVKLLLGQEGVHARF